MIKAETAVQRFGHNFLILIFVLTGCAKSIAPPGGPADRTPPQIINSNPPSGSIMVPLDSKFILEFSEAIDRTSAAKSVFITPRSEPEPKVNIKSRTIEISFPGGLDSNKTYVVTIGADLRDAHKVNMTHSTSIAFSTGNVIDSGSISGIIYKDDKEASGIGLALLEGNPDETGLPIDSLLADYFTQSGEGGIFQFPFLPDNHYYLIAFDDRNKNRLINPATELIGLPYRSTIIDSLHRQIENINISITRTDTGLIGIRSVSINPDLLIKVRFDREMERAEATELFKTISIFSVVDGATSLEYKEVAGYNNLNRYPCRDFLFKTGALGNAEKLGLSFDLSSIYPGIAESLQTVAYQFENIAIDDLNPPELLETVPANGDVNFHPDSLFRFRLSEVVDSARFAMMLLVADTIGETSFVHLSPISPFEFEGKPENRLDFGRKYRLLLHQSNIRDMAGNGMGDSLTTIDFDVIGRDTLGQISGEVNLTSQKDAEYPIVIVFHPAREGVEKEITLEAGQQRFYTDLLPGYYTISAYLDRNKNSRFDTGSIIPYRLAEPFVVNRDTFRVRTRFESSEVLLEL